MFAIVGRPPRVVGEDGRSSPNHRASSLPVRIVLLGRPQRLGRVHLNVLNRPPLVSVAGRPEARCVIVGEVAQAHDGSLGTAHAFIDAIATAGADAVKFQTHIASAESTHAEPWRVRFSVQDESRYAYWRRMEFTEEQWHGLRRHATDRGLLFLSSPFSIEAVDLLTRVGVAAW